MQNSVKLNGRLTFYESPALLKQLTKAKFKCFQIAPASLIPGSVLTSKLFSKQEALMKLVSLVSFKNNFRAVCITLELECQPAAPGVGLERA